MVQPLAASGKQGEAMPRPEPSSRPSRRLQAALAGTAVTLLSLAAAGAVGPAAAQELGPLTRVSRPASPFAGCRADRPAGQSGDLYPTTEIEPFVAANPRNPN